MARVRKRVVVIVPTYNEKGNIERLSQILYEQIFPKLLDQYEPRLLVVDDSSPDGTGAIVKQLQTHQADLYLLVNPKKLGLGYAYTQGMNYAIRQLKADYLMEFDADLSHDPAKIPPMLAKLDQGDDLVLGCRYIPGGGIPKNWGWHRKFLSVMSNWFTRLVMGEPSIHDWTGGFRAMRREVAAAVLPGLNRQEFMGYTFQVGFLIAARRQGFRISEVPFHFKNRTVGKSKMPAAYIKTTLIYILSVRLEELARQRYFRFIIVGTIGGLIQLTSLQIMRWWLPYQVATFISIELAILSNFILSNRWTFADRPLSFKQMPVKFIQFNLTSAGSLLIQQVVAYLGETRIGLYPVTLPLTQITLDTGLIFAMIGISLGMGWNFFAYSTIIWKKGPN
ncbi:hypothetical protein A2W24_00880 [Microgenomates group bacterium RBG_16_45_19]|nr:MAG: hypothetical protein A2W24_00880 [Microgenomates group bacterium RBG_16_45_19]